MSGDRDRYGTRLGQDGLWQRDGGSFVAVHRAPTDLERACRFMLDHCAWPSQQAAFNACWAAAARLLFTSECRQFEAPVPEAPIRPCPSFGQTPKSQHLVGVTRAEGRRLSQPLGTKI